MSILTKRNRPRGRSYFEPAKGKNVKRISHLTLCSFSEGGCSRLLFKQKGRRRSF